MERVMCCAARSPHLDTLLDHVLLQAQTLRLPARDTLHIPDPRHFTPRRMKTYAQKNVNCNNSNEARSKKPTAFNAASNVVCRRCR
eukprot:1395371-Rhodomonas_salina.4